MKRFYSFPIRWLKSSRKTGSSITQLAIQHTTSDLINAFKVKNRFEKFKRAIRAGLNRYVHQVSRFKHLKAC
jgi:hypothetical protein